MGMHRTGVPVASLYPALPDVEGSAVAQGPVCERGCFARSGALLVSWLLIQTLPYGLQLPWGCPPLSGAQESRWAPKGGLRQGMVRPER